MIEALVGLIIGALAMKFRQKPFPTPLTPMQIDKLWSEWANGNQGFTGAVRLIEREHGIGE